MANTQLGPVLLQVRLMAAAEGLAEATDGQLLDRFSARQEEGAFAALLLRHGPMVLGVARRVLRQEQDVEDVFQASFLLLARKVGSIRKRESVGSWLHGVAHRLAVQAKGRAARRQAHERRAGTMRQKRTNRDGAWQELGEALDQALADLPEKYREAVVLCCLEALTQEEAARRTGCPLGTVRSRLARGRELLRKQLAWRGVTLSAGAFATLLAAGPAPAAVPAAVLHGTARVALQASTGKALAGLVSPRVAALVAEATKAMMMTKAKAVVALAVALSIAVGAGVFAHQARSANNPATAEESAPKPQAENRGPQAEEKQAQTDAHGDLLPPGAVARLGTARFRQGSIVWAVACSPDGEVVASRDGHGGLYLWQAGTGKLLRRAELSHAELGSVAFLPGGKSLAVVEGWAGSVHLWDFASGREPAPKLKRVPRSYRDDNMLPRNTGFVASPDGKLVAGIQGLDRICVWELATGTEVGQLKEAWRFDEPNKSFQRLAFSPDSKVLAAVMWQDGRLWLWEAATGKELHRVEAGLAAMNTGSLPLAFSPDGKYLAVGQPDGAVRLFDVAAGKEARVLRGPAAEGAADNREVFTVAFSPDGKTLAFAVGDNLVHLWDVASGKEVRQLCGHKNWVMSVAFSPDGKRLISGAQDNTVRVWDVATGQEVGPAGGHGYAVLAVAPAPDGRTIATGSGRDDTIRLWDARTGKELRAIPTRQEWVGALAFSPDGKWLASGGGTRDRAICLWDAATGREVRRFIGHEREISNGCLAFSPDGKVLLSGGGDRIARLWKVDTGREIHALTGHENEVSCVAFSPDGSLVASGEWSHRSKNPDVAIRIWDAATGKEVRRLRGQKHVVEALAFSPDGRTLASAGGSSGPATDPDFADALLLWDVTTGKVVRRLAGTPARKTGAYRHVRGLAFSPDGKTLVTGESDHPIVLYETTTGRARHELAGHDGDVWALAFTPDGSALVSAGSGNTALVWDATGGFRKPRRGGLSPAELEGFWTDLSGDDAAKAFQTVQAMTAAAPQAMPFLKERLRPVAVDLQGIARRIADLDSNRFTVRQEATAELEKLSELAEPALVKALEGKPSAEASRRIGQLLEKIAVQRRSMPPPEPLRALRAVEVLEQTGTREARQVLEALAQGTPEARLTQEAKSSLERLARQPVTTR
jgi:RNA polymerase sigma factor (sigma-70 family)